jgi:uncharacterized NAD(P)/FAD-binding protein YdhS
MRSIAIIGAGYSGAATALLLARGARAPLELRLIDPRPAPGRGLAHSTPEPDHRLNGPDAIHSPYPDAPDHFAAWMRDSGALARDPGALADTGRVFPRRGDFGAYMSAEVARHARSNPSGSRIDHVARAARRVRVDNAGGTVELDDGTTLRADACVLALGWDAPGVPAALAGLTGHPRWLGDAWDPCALDRVPRHARVLLVGAGLTASDVFAALLARGHDGPVLALSRHGLRPASQNPYRSNDPLWARLLDPEPAFVHRHGRPRTVATLLRALREDIATVDPERESWHGRFDDLRDASHLFWPALAAAERRRYVRHLKSRYDASRYRNPPQVERILERGLASGRLAYAAGRLVHARADGDGLRVGFVDRADGVLRDERFDAVVNCTGPQPRPSASRNPVWRAAIADGLVRDDACGIGIEVDALGRPVGADGRVHGRLFAIGPPTIGSLGEATAAPYISRRVLWMLDPLQAAAGV